MAWRSYTSDFRQKAIALAIEKLSAGETLEKIAKELGVHTNSLRRWIDRVKRREAARERTQIALVGARALGIAVGSDDDV